MNFALSNQERDTLDIGCRNESDGAALTREPDFAAAVRTLIHVAGDDPNREGLQDTPSRMARAYSEWFAGYSVNPEDLLRRTFNEANDYEETVLLRDIPVVSTCEHHLAPIIGVAHVAYRPRRRVVGISKLSRVVEAYARRLQLQERLTSQIAEVIEKVLDPHGVAVVLRAAHACMTTRGVNQPGVTMTTQCWRGDFRDDFTLRAELMASLATQ